MHLSLAHPPLAYALLHMWARSGRLAMLLGNDLAAWPATGSGRLAMLLALLHMWARSGRLATPAALPAKDLTVCMGLATSLGCKRAAWPARGWAFAGRLAIECTLVLSVIRIEQWLQTPR